MSNPDNQSAVIGKYVFANKVLADRIRTHAAELDVTPERLASVFYEVNLAVVRAAAAVSRQRREARDEEKQNPQPSRRAGPKPAELQQ